MFAALVRNVFWLVMLFAVAGAGYYMWTKSKPCVAPIEYTIGMLDPRFGVTRAQFIDDITQASGIWGKAAGKTLFEYNPKGSLTISLVYDMRQKTTQEESKLKSSIDQANHTADSAKQTYLAAEASFKAATQSYDTALANFNAAQNAYNSRVDYWNRNGGAPQSEYAALQTEKNSLQTKRSSLEAQRQELDNLAHQVNTLADAFNAQADKVNANVQKFNSDGLAGTQFEEGVYISDASGRRIDIYQFDNKTTFIRVLAHELGHALGLEHDQDSGSIMNPVNTGTSLKLSPQDLAELKAECSLH